MADSTSPAISSSLLFSSSSSIVKWRKNYAFLPGLAAPPRRLHFESQPGLPKSSRDVIFRLLTGGVLEDHIRLIVLDQTAHEEEAREIGHTRCLLHVVGDDDHGALIFQPKHELFDLGGGDGIEGGTGLIQQEHFGIDGQRPGDAQALLLSARKCVRRFKIG